MDSVTQTLSFSVKMLPSIGESLNASMTFSLLLHTAINQPELEPIYSYRAIERERSFAYAPAVLLADNEVVTPAESREDPECLKRKLKEICNPETNVIMERHNFNTRNQKAGETIEAYVSTLRNQAKSCSFGALADELSRNKLVCGVSSDNGRRTLLKETDLTLSKVICICQISELTEKHSKALSTQKTVTTANVDTVHVKHKRFNSKTKQSINLQLQ